MPSLLQHPSDASAHSFGVLSVDSPLQLESEMDHVPARLPPLRSIPGKVRIVKDVLKCGEWCVAINPDTGEPIIWKVTPATLKTLVDVFVQHWTIGIRHPLRWKHGEDKEELDDRDSIDDLTDFWIEETPDGPVLWFACYVTPEDFAALTEKRRRPVSIWVVFRWRDGHGKSWPMSIRHVACVDHPVVPGLGPFLKMGDRPPLVVVPKKEKIMDFAKMIAGLNKLLAHAGAPTLPTDGEGAVTEDNFDQLFQMVLGTIDLEESDATEGANKSGTTTVVDGVATGAPAVSSEVLLGNRMSSIERIMVKLGSAIEALASRPNITGEAGYRARVIELIEAGLPGAAAQMALTVGPGNGWNVATLNELAASIPGVKLGSQTGSLVSGNPKAIPDTFAPLAEADVNEELKKMGVRPKEAATAK